MFSIDELASLAQVSEKAIQYYSEMGWLKPCLKDLYTDKLYYAANQLNRLYRILALEGLGIAQEQITQIIDESPPPQIRAMLEQQQIELELLIQQEQKRFARIERRIEKIEQKGCNTEYEVVIKSIQPQTAASIHDVISRRDDVIWLIEEVMLYIEQLRTEPISFPRIVWHDTEYQEQHLDIEVVIPLRSPVPHGVRVRSCEFAGIETVACVVHRGSYLTIDEAYYALWFWVEANNYVVVGPEQEILLHFDTRGRRLGWPSEWSADGPEQFVTEVQLPIQKI